MCAFESTRATRQKAKDDGAWCKTEVAELAFEAIKAHVGRVSTQTKTITLGSKILRGGGREVVGSTKKTPTRYALFSCFLTENEGDVLSTQTSLDSYPKPYKLETVTLARSYVERKVFRETGVNIKSFLKSIFTGETKTKKRIEAVASERRNACLITRRVGSRPASVRGNTTLYTSQPILHL